jgi:hypothetical protein
MKLSLRAGAACIVALCAAGCAANSVQTQQRLESHLVGQNVDVLIAQWGPPSSTFPMNNGGKAYTWLLTSGADFAATGDRYGAAGTSQGFKCKINVSASQTGIISSLATEDQDRAGGGLVGAVVLASGGGQSVCARYLGVMRQ